MDQLSKMEVFVFIPSKESLFLTQISCNITTCSLAHGSFNRITSFRPFQ